MAFAAARMIIQRDGKGNRKSADLSGDNEVICCTIFNSYIAMSGCVKSNSQCLLWLTKKRIGDIIVMVQMSPEPFRQTNVYNHSFFHLWANFDNLQHADTLWPDSIFLSLQPNKKTKNAPKIANARPPVTSVKVRRVKSAKGNIREQHDLIINIDLVLGLDNWRDTVM